MHSMEKDPNNTKVKDVLSRGLFKARTLKLGLMGFNLIGLTTFLYLIFWMTIIIPPMIEISIIIPTNKGQNNR